MNLHIWRLGATSALVIGIVAGCSEPGTETSEPDLEPATSEVSEGNSATASDAPAEGCPEPQSTAGAEYDEALNAELVEMFERDQAGRTGGADPEGDQARTDRLREIITEHGWPGFDLVGTDGENAAWAIAQHSDLDPDFQTCALEHLALAVEDGQASPGNLAYLADRIAVAVDEPQTYGTQVGVCGPDGPQPATPLVDPERVDELRAEVGLEPLQDYYEEFADMC